MFVVISYFLLFLLLHILYGDGVKNKAVRKQQAYVIFLLLFAFWGFRDLPVLNDTNHYYYAQYKLINSYSFQNSDIFYRNIRHIWEPGFLIYQNIIGKLWPNPYAIIIISTSILIISTLIFINKFTNYIALCIFYLLTFGYFIAQVSAIRQGIALSIFYLGINCILKDKYLMTAFVIYIATLFHSSAVIFLLLWILYYIPPTKKNALMGFIVIIFISLFLESAVNLVGLNENYYIENARERQAVPIAGIINSFVYLTVITISLIIKKIYKIQMPCKIITWGTLLGFYFSVIAIQILVLTRYSIYFGGFAILFFIHFIMSTPRRIRTLSIFIISIVFICRSVIIFEYKNEWFHLIPYSMYDIFDEPKIIQTGY